MTQRLLIAYSMSSTYVQTTLDYLLMLQKHIGFNTDFIHVTHGAHINFDLNNYDVILNSYCARHCFDSYVSSSFVDALKCFQGVKVIAAQDEYTNTNTLKAAVKDIGFDIFLTCVPQSGLEQIYPQQEFPNTEFITVLTGYVPDSLASRGRSTKPLDQRSRYIGYRGRNIGGKYGRLGFDKYEIGRRMKAECRKRGLPCDIAMEENSRIYGTRWYDFIEDCRVMLGSESGSNVFDFDGSIAAKYEQITLANFGKPPSYEEFAPYVRDHESTISMGQISPRVFECASLRTPMVLFEGSYSDVIEPDTHYIALSKDFSNVDYVLAKVTNTTALEKMAERTHHDLVASGEFGYRAFCVRLRHAIESSMTDKQPKLSSVTSPTGLVDPRKQPENKLPRKQRALAEVPTKTPKEIKDFEKAQLRLAQAAAKDAATKLINGQQGFKHDVTVATTAFVQGSKIAKIMWSKLPGLCKTLIKSRLRHT